jgi:hypothetical protein
MKGNVASINRVNDIQVIVRGWLADPEGDATSLTLSFLWRAKSSGDTDSGERPDVGAWHLAQNLMSPLK